MSHNIDKIFYINLDNATERRCQIELELNNMNLSYERFEAIRHIIGCVGCSYSHLHVMRIAKERGYTNVLILEDDFMFTVTKDEFEKHLTTFFDHGIEYDVCMFSFNMRDQETTEYSFINKVNKAQTASGYLVNSHYFDTLINIWEQSIPLLETTGQHWKYACDVCWYPLQSKDKWYSFIPCIGKQRPGFSYISQQYMDHNC